MCNSSHVHNIYCFAAKMELYFLLQFRRFIPCDFVMIKLIFCLTRLFAYKQEISVSAGNTTSDTSDTSGTSGTSDVYLLTRGRAWAISLSMRNALSEKFLSASVIGMDTEDLLYR